MQAYIERNLAETVIKKFVESDCTPFDKQEALDNLRSIPTADVQEVKHAKLVKDKYGMYCCSNCDNAVPVNLFGDFYGPYCTYCGAKIDGKD